MSVLAVSATSPPNCPSNLHHVPNPSRWTACFQQGLHEPTTTASQAGFAVGHNILWIIIAAVVVILIAKAATGKSSTPAASKS